jgi:hypothetical protein
MSVEVTIDSRICVKRTENGFNIDRQDIAIPDAVEVLERILFCIRVNDFHFAPVEGYERSVIDSIKVYPEEPIDNPKVCIAFDYVTHKIQVAVIGLDLWDACTLLNTARNYLNALMLGIITE